jgi:hypothetical protein
MEDFLLTVTGSNEEMDVLEEFCRKYGVAPKHGVVSSYEGVAATMFAVYITAQFDIVCQCIAAYRGTRKAPLKVTHYAPGKGTLVLEDFSSESVAKVLRTTDQLLIENAWA